MSEQTNSLAVFQFNGNEVRTQVINNEPWFVAKDVAEILGYCDTNAMTRRLDEDEVTTCADKSSGQVRSVCIISESGLYNAILGSSKPEAKQFKKWVTGELLPAIRKNGSYVASAGGETLEELTFRAMQGLQAAVERQKAMLDDARATIARKDEAIASTRETVARLAPAAEYTETVLSSKSLHTINAVAGMLGISARNLNQKLVDAEWIYRQGDIYCVSYKVRNKGYFQYCVVPYFNSNGDPCTREHLKVTENGRKAILEKFSPLVKGGQGRSAANVEASAKEVCFSGTLLIVGFAAMLIFA